jgi:hypothetical protein
MTNSSKPEIRLSEQMSFIQDAIDDATRAASAWFYIDLCQTCPRFDDVEVAS